MSVLKEGRRRIGSNNTIHKILNVYMKGRTEGEEVIMLYTKCLMSA